MADETRWYASKVDWWLAPILALPPVAAVAVCILLAIDKPKELPIGLGAAALVAALYIGVVHPIRYGLDNENLTVRFGLVRERIPLVTITEVRPTRNPFSAPALSLDRLHIQFGQGFTKAVMISPSDRDQFLDDLAHRAGLTRDGERLFRE